MKKNLVILLFSVSTNLFCQTIKPYSGIYENGQIAYIGQNWYPSLNYGFPIGFFNYWHENGQRKLETFYWFTGDYKSSNIRYNNMWLADGKQILKAGNGIYYSVSSSKNETIKDSSVYEIKDSIKNGVFNLYRKYLPDNYFLVQIGEYSLGKPKGKSLFRDSLASEIIEFYFDDEGNINALKYFYNNHQIKSEGKLANYKKEELWKFYDSNGRLKKEVYYKNGEATGEIKEFLYNKKGDLIKTKMYMANKNGSS